MPKPRKRKPDLRRIRPTKVYMLLEIAETLDRNITTVRSWVGKGLPLLNEKKPVLVLGSDLKEWLQAVQAAKQQKCQPGELYCFKCRCPRTPLPGSMKIVPRNEKTVSIKGLCAVCGTRMNQAGSRARIDEMDVRLHSPSPQKQRITVCGNPGVNHALAARHIKSPKSSDGRVKSPQLPTNETVKGNTCHEPGQNRFQRQNRGAHDGKTSSR
jgi:hypothetical protein